jgi:hypothetical protein
LEQLTTQTTTAAKIANNKVGNNTNKPCMYFPFDLSMILIT